MRFLSRIRASKGLSERTIAEMVGLARVNRQAGCVQTHLSLRLIFT